MLNVRCTLNQLSTTLKIEHVNKNDYSYVVSIFVQFVQSILANMFSNLSLTDRQFEQLFTSLYTCSYAHTYPQKNYISEIQG